MVKSTAVSWCSCFQKPGPPEIIYSVVDNFCANTLQWKAPLPIPPEEELNAKFTQLVEELDLTSSKREAMFGLSAEKKWQIYCSKKLDEQPVISPNGDVKSNITPQPEFYIEQVKALSMMLFPVADCQEVHSRVFMVESLKTALRTQPNSFVAKFIENDGLSSLIGFLKEMNQDTEQSPIHTSVIGCLKALMNNSTGRSHVLAHADCIKVVSQSLSCQNIKTKISVLEILGAVCLVPGGHKKVLEAMMHFQRYSMERTRFQTVVNDLDRSTGVYRDNINLKTCIMSFINAILSYGPGQESMDFRLHMRYEFLMLGIQPVIEKLKRHDNETLNRHIQFFEMVRKDDEKQLAKKFNQQHIDTKSASAMFHFIQRKISHTAAYPHLLSLLEHMLIMPINLDSCPQHWSLFDRVVQQIVLQSSSETGEDCDIAPLNINVKEIVSLIAREEEITSAKKRAEELEVEMVELAGKLTVKEQECERKTQEKEDLESTNDKMKVRLENETIGHMGTQQKLSELDLKLNDVSERLEQCESEKQRLEQMLQMGCISDDTKVGLRSSRILQDTSNELNKDCKIGSPGRQVIRPVNPPPMPPVAPPPPPMLNGSGGPPPPPPPSTGFAAVVNKSPVVVKKNIPKPSNPLKSFNWSKIPDNKLTGTIWQEIDDTKLFKDIDLDEFDRTFSAYQKEQNDPIGSTEDLHQIGNNVSKVIINGNCNGRVKELSLIDGRRAQNCTILLSKLKMTNEEICNLIMQMDPKDQLPRDMLDQIIKFLPSNEEKALLEEHCTEIEHLARADKFIYDVSRIDRYEQRLKTLNYKKKFLERVGECQPRIESITTASKQVLRSKKLKQLLEVVLAFGNYMNRGQRGNASGFKLSSLNKLSDTKSNVNRSMTLLHYLVATLEKKFKDVLRIEDELPQVRHAAKVNLNELDKDMATLRAGLKEIEKEIETQRRQPNSGGNKFVSVMRGFLASATYKFSEVEDLYQDMKQKYDKAVKLFGEDPSTISPEEFFGIFDGFMTAFSEARQDNENFRRRREEEERRAKQEAEFKKKRQEKYATLERGSNIAGGKGKGAVTNGEFDDLISALRTGDVFGEDMIKMKRNTLRRGSSRDRDSGGGTASPRSESLVREEGGGSRERLMNGMKQARAGKVN